MSVCVVPMLTNTGFVCDKTGKSKVSVNYHNVLMNQHCVLPHYTSILSVQGFVMLKSLGLGSSSRIAASFALPSLNFPAQPHYDKTLSVVNPAQPHYSQGVNRVNRKYASHAVLQWTQKIAREHLHLKMWLQSDLQPCQHYKHLKGDPSNTCISPSSSIH